MFQRLEQVYVKYVKSRQLVAHVVRNCNIIEKGTGLYRVLIMTFHHAIVEKVTGLYPVIIMTYHHASFPNVGT